MFEYFPLVTGIWLVALSFILHTENFISKMVFNVIPFFLGTGSLVFSLKHLGFV